MAQVPSHTHTFTFDIPSASSAEVAAGTSDSKAVTPLALAGAGETFLGLLGGGAAGIDVFQSVTPADARTVLELGTASTSATGDFATAAQGVLADTAVQPADLATVATTGQYTDIVGTPTLGTAAAQDSTAFATSAQGLLADSAVQPGDGEAVPAGGTTGQVLAKASATDGDTFWTIAGQGDIISTNNGSDFADPAATLANLGGLAKADNLAGLTAPDTALTNLGISTAALQNFVKAASASTAFSALALALSGGTQSRSQIDRTQEKRYSLFEWIPAALIAGILAGTNTTPVTTYVQAALNSGKPIEVPIGTFLLDAQVNPPADAVLVGSHRYKSIFKVADSVNINAFLATAKDNIAFRDFTVDCNKANQTAGNGLIFGGCNHLSLTGVVVKNPFNDGISLDDDCWYFNVSDNEVWSAGNHGISLSGNNMDGESVLNCRYGSVHNNRVYNPTASGINGSECHHVSFVGNHIQHDGSHTAGNGGVRLTNGARDCPVVANTTAGMSRGIYLIEAYRCPVVCNTIDSSGLQGICVAADTVATFLESADCPVVGNTVRNPGRNALSDGIRLVDANRCPVGFNTVLCSDSQMEYAVRSTGGNRNIITANTSVGATVADFYADNTSDKVYGNNGDRSDDAIASAATITLPSDGEFFNITGTTAITTINGGWQGRRVTLRLQNGLTLNHGTGNLSLNGDVNKAIAAGETINLAFLPNTWFQA